MTAPSLRSVLLFLFFCSFGLVLHAQKSRSSNYINEYGKYNADKTLRLEYIEQDDDYTIVYVAYTGTSNSGSFTSLYLNNFRLVDRATDKEYKPTDTGLLPTNTDGKFFLYNSGTDIMLSIKFRRIPSSVKNIDLIESDGAASSTYNFTFRNLYLDPSEHLPRSLLKKAGAQEGYAAMFYTYEELTIDVSIDGSMVGKIDRRFNNRSYTPSCGEYGSLTVMFASDDRRKFSATASNSKSKYTWNFNFIPKEGDCEKKNLTIN